MKKFYSIFKSKFIQITILTFTSISVTAQRTIPYPIILVHGWGGEAKTWDLFTQNLQSQFNLTIETNYLKYNLNCDNNLNTSYLYSDVCDSNYGSIGNKDVYIVDFNNGYQSNQSAIVKQGYSLKFAINKVLIATGADKVILMGHSMGGLAIREYLQNSTNWQPDGQHHISKLVTIGTPHYGSNTSIGILINLISLFKLDENSESVRDLRESYFYSNCTRAGQAIQCPGVYLWGGQETRSWMKTNALGGSSYYNIDVNCNGSNGDNVTGLNQKSISLDLDFSCVIGGPYTTDGIVSAYNQNINNVNSNLNAEIFYFDCNGDANCHRNEPKNAFKEMIEALDEPKKYLTNFKFSETIKGFYTTQSNGSQIDKDEFIVYAPSRGVISYNINSVESANAVITIKNQNGTVLESEYIGNYKSNSFQIKNSGNLYVSVSGNSNGNWSTYSFSFGFCGLPEDPTISASGTLSFCEGENITLNATSGYDSYNWLKDGNIILNTNNQLNVIQSGNYTVQGTQCGVSINSSNSINVQVNIIPNKPNISKEELPDKFVLKSSISENIEWYFNGNLLNDEKSQTFNPQELGYYKVKVIKDGCSNVSDDVLIKMEKPSLIIEGKSAGCEGDSLKIKTASNFSNYTFSDGKNEINSSKNEVSLKKSGSYSVVTHRGTFSSPPSDPVSISIYPFPPKPILTIENFSLKSSSNSNNQWLVNGIELKDSTNQTVKILGAENFQVKVTENGCSIFSDKFQILAEEKNLLKECNLKIFPNPNNGIFDFEFYSTDLKPVEINIYDGLGKKIYHKTVKIIGKYSDKINISNKPSGQYYLSMQKEGSIKAAKFEKN